MMNSNWQIEKIGLLDFWYYDEEEFHFEDGRMLLRGANGSGKSVTMQSFIPLLLDGNMRPERLDPFGSRARRMENYLLEDNDGREERTAYLYMEFKREDSETYVTIGIGMRARRGKPLDTWYFFLQDGRRVGKDFYLCRQEKEKVPLTKQELKNRIGDGGQVIDSQKEYMARVNRMIFGFETDEAYKELVDLLIQLRTPKLSKDFKPSIINDILSNSLMPLSEDDLRPMSEAIENMDGLKSSLDDLKGTVAAAKSIGRVYDKYNRFILYHKSKHLREFMTGEKREQQELRQIEDKLAGWETRLTEESSHREELHRELELRQAEIDSYGDSDVSRLKKEQGQLLLDQQHNQEELDKKEEISRYKKEQRIEAENRSKELLDKMQGAEGEMDQLLEDMSQGLETAAFDEHEFLQAELKKQRGQPYNFSMHKELLERLRGNIEMGIDQLKEEQLQKSLCDKQLQQVEEKSRRRDAQEREVTQHEDQLRTVKNELLEALNLWSQNADEMQVPQELMREIAITVEGYDTSEQYETIRDKVREVYTSQQDGLRLEQSKMQHEWMLKEREVTAKKAELADWEAQRDPIPERSEAVNENRKRLDEAGIPYEEFYKVVDFPDKMDEKQKDQLEEALHSMGILDALIVDIEDFPRIKALDPGTCDRYLLTDVKGVSSNLSEWMEIVNEENDILFYQKVMKALGAVGFEASKEEHTAIYKDGHYRLGALTGTITGNYKAKFIGVKARQDYREQKRKELSAQLMVLLEEQQMIEEQKRQMEERLRDLSLQWNAFPDGGDLKVAIQTLAEVRYALEQIRREVEQLQILLDEQLKQLNELRQEIRKICEKAYLPANLEVFQTAREEVEQYRKDLHGLELAHQRYLMAAGGVRDVEEQMDRIDEDLDVALGDIRDLHAARKRIDQRLESIEEQLILTDAAGIQEKIDLAYRRIRTIPQELEGCASQITALNGAMTSGQQERVQRTERMLVLRSQSQIMQEAVVKEAKLGCYSDIVMGMLEEGSAAAEKIADHVFRNEDGVISNLDRNGVTSDLQEVFFENRGMLAEYSPVLNKIFEEVSSGEPLNVPLDRLELRTRYRGISMNFQEFLKGINQDIEEKMSLLDDKERELFEDILLGVINRKIRGKIYNSEAWVEGMNNLMSQMRTSSGIRLSLKWKSKHAEHEGQLDTRQLVALLKKDQKWMTEEESEQLLNHFRSKIQEARKALELEHGIRSFHAIVRDILDYRQWFEFRLEFEKLGEKKKELTDRDFFTFSGGEKAMSMYVPLFSAVVAKYEAAREDAPRLISLDEAFAGVDARNINDMFRLMVDFRFSFIINSQILWGDYETIPRLVIYQLLRADNAKFVTVIPYLWNGKERTLMVE